MDYKPRLTILLLGLVLPFYAHADGLSYSYIQAAFATSDVDVAGVNVDGDGFIISGSAELTENLAFSASFDDQSYDFDIDANSFTFGVDYHNPISSTTDMVLGFSVINGEVSQPSLGSEDDTGNIISAGIRSKPNDNAEFEVNVSRVDIFDDSSIGFSLSLLVSAGGNVQFGVAYAGSEDADTIGFGVRANF